MDQDILDRARDWKARSGGDIGDLLGELIDEIEALRAVAGKARQDDEDTFRNAKNGKKNEAKDDDKKSDKSKDKKE